jgi:hypothetical protein
LSGIEQARGLTSSSDGRSHIGANTAGAKYWYNSTCEAEV